MDNTVSSHDQEGNPQNHPLYDRVPYQQKMTPRELFWSKVEKTETCWLWKADTDGVGYGRMNFHHKRMGAHRFSYELAYGPIPNGMVVCHKCDVKLCVRPDHLFLGTQADNLRDMRSKGRGKTPFVPQHDACPHGETHYQAKLTVEKVKQIRELAPYYSLYQLEAMFGVSRATIRNVIIRKTWKHVA